MTKIAAAAENEVMSSMNIAPSTIEGIKRSAVRIKRELGVAHVRALDVAAQRAGFASFRHAQNTLDGAALVRERTPRHAIWITAYWRDRDGTSGRETLGITAGVPWCDVLRQSELRSARGLARFRVDASDHFESRQDLMGQDAAQRAVCEAARTLQFMELTGLRPATRQVSLRFRELGDLPQRDHASEWIDPTTGRSILVDEPYIDIDQVLAARSPWAKERGIAVAVTTWAGMYFPGMATLCFASADGDIPSLARYAAVLDAAPAPVAADDWRGESAPYKPLFLSPARVATRRRKRGRPYPLTLGMARGGAVVYGDVLLGPCWRPDARMPLEAHREAGNLLKEVLDHGGLRSRAWARLSHVQSQLDEWVQREYPSREDLPSDVFPNLYYYAFSPTGLAANAALARVEALLRQHYPDCVPRRDLIRCLATAQRDLGRRQRRDRSGG